jgi:hypothetical protein
MTENANNQTPNEQTPPVNGGQQQQQTTPPPATPPATTPPAATPPAEQPKEDPTKALLESLGVSSIDEVKGAMKKLQDIEDAGKTELQKTADQAKKAADKLKEYEEQVFTLTAEKAALAADANPDSVTDIITLAKAHTNKDTDITKAISLVLQKYPQFKKSGGEATSPANSDNKKPQFAQNQQQGGQQTEQDKWNAAFKNIFAKQ